MARTKQRENYDTGSITPALDSDKKQRKDKQGRLGWDVVISLGTTRTTTSDGRRKKERNRIKKRFYGTLSEARDFRDRLKKQYENIDTSAREKTFSDAVRAWETSMRNANTASPNVLQGYLCNLRHMERHIGDKVLVSITKQDIEDALAAVKEERRFSNSSVKKCHAVTKRVFEYAVDSDWVVRNPVSKVKAPRADEVVTRRSLTKDECARFRACLDDAEAKAIEEFEAKEDRQADWGNTFGRSRLSGLSHLSCIMALRLELATGMRRSEVLGLTWDAVDFKTSRITVKQKLIEIRKDEREGDESLHIGSTKTANSLRCIKVGKTTMEHLKDWKAFQKKALHLVMPDGHAITQDGNTPVFCGDNGSWLRPSRLSVWWGVSGQRGFRDEIGFPDLLMHELRHTQATQLLGDKVDVKTVQHRLGHSKSSLTLDLYAHAIPENDDNAADLIDEICNRPAQPSAIVTDLPNAIKTA